MSVVQEQHPAASRDFHVFTLTSPKGNLVAKFTNFGATLTHLIVKDKDGKARDVVSGFDNPSDFANQPHPYFGAVIGRVGNRIKKAQFQLNGKTYQLNKNDGENHLHGGNKGFDKAFWTATIESQNPPTLRFNYTSPDSEENYPGAIDVTVIYTLTDSKLSFDYSAKLSDSNPADLQTIVNLTSHPYFNLSGYETPDIRNHTLHLPTAKSVLQLGPGGIPTGEVLSFASRPDLDFTTKPKIVSADINNIKDPGFPGFDHHWLIQDVPSAPYGDVISGDKAALSKVSAAVSSPDTGITMNLYTDSIGLQFYSGNFLGAGGVNLQAKESTQKFGGEVPVYKQYSGFCLEPSAPVDAASHEAWRKTVVLSKGQTWKQTMILEFVIA
ncbi:hypothetical protein HK097_009067 [Rhizophlyctis rosea]|uniref:Aldose 1-epimerase n=1 Tax=Rhizophlyctis rosea TaxID=64517 RepID=A0AAD5X1B4_9FUNG|nr:hypothetical protein HK097_009067 [Rhizophlyctis rosea]